MQPPINILFQAKYFFSIKVFFLQQQQQKQQLNTSASQSLITLLPVRSLEIKEYYEELFFIFRVTF